MLDGFVTSRYLRLSQWGELELIVLAFVGLGAIAYMMFQRLKPHGKSDVSPGAYVFIIVVVVGLFALLITNMQWESPDEAASTMLHNLEREQHGR